MFEVSLDAAREVREAAHWYSSRVNGLGDRLVEEFAAALRDIEAQPLRFGLLETTRSKKQYRRAQLPSFPYLVIYCIRGNDIFVSAVAHSSRKPNYWIRRTR